MTSKPNPKSSWIRNIKNQLSALIIGYKSAHGHSFTITNPEFFSREEDVFIFLIDFYGEDLIEQVREKTRIKFIYKISKNKDEIIINWCNPPYEKVCEFAINKIAEYDTTQPHTEETWIGGLDVIHHCFLGIMYGYDYVAIRDFVFKTVKTPMTMQEYDDLFMKAEMMIKELSK
jgi:hypothetical protein